MQLERMSHLKEALVQWTLLNNKDHLSKWLQFPFARRVGQEISTDYGRIDFVLENRNHQHLIVELETTLDTSSKLKYCFDQVLNYKNVWFTQNPKNTNYCILYADETNPASHKQVRDFGKENDVLIKTYSIEEIKKLYTETIERLSLNVGLALPNPKNYTICFLRWLNKILKPFHDLKKEILTFREISAPFTGATNFNCYKRLAFDFEMIEERNNNYHLTKYGKEYIENLSPYVFQTSNVPSVDLTNEQKRLLLKVLTNGNWDGKVHKMNVYWFMRFVEVTDGNWLPTRSPFDNERLEIAKGLFKVSYKHKTMKQFLNWCCNYCEELGLIERIKSTTDYDRLLLTPLGVEVNNIFSLDLSLKKSRMNLSFKYSE